MSPPAPVQRSSSPGVSLSRSRMAGTGGGRGGSATDAMSCGTTRSSTPRAQPGAWPARSLRPGTRAPWPPGAHRAAGRSHHVLVQCGSLPPSPGRPARIGSPRLSWCPGAGFPALAPPPPARAAGTGLTMARPRWRIPGRGSRAGGPLPRSQAPVRQRVIAATMSLAWITAAAASVPHVRLTAGNECLLGVLLVSALLVSLPRSDRTAPGVPESTAGAGELPAAVLLPPTLAFTAPVAVTAIACWRLRRVPRKLDAVVAGLADGIVSLSFHALAPPLPVPGIRAVAWLLAVAAAGAMRWALICAVFLAV